MSTSSETVRIDFVPIDGPTLTHSEELEHALFNYVKVVKDPDNTRGDSSVSYYEERSEAGVLGIFGVNRTIPGEYDALEWTRAVEELRAEVSTYLAAQGLQSGLNYLDAGSVPSNPPVRDYERK
jgi:hypothetical protein